MKIMKHGNHTQTTKKFECCYCGCIFEANKEEYEEDAMRYPDRTVIYRYICDCPECNATVSFSEKGS